jgi:hypothetical protein
MYYAEGKRQINTRFKLPSLKRRPIGSAKNK